VARQTDTQPRPEDQGAEGDDADGTIGSQFHYQLADGTQGNGIPQLLPQLVLPWDMPSPHRRRAS
jgi:hypothetical protein